MAVDLTTISHEIGFCIESLVQISHIVDKPRFFIGDLPRSPYLSTLVLVKGFRKDIIHEGGYFVPVFLSLWTCEVLTKCVELQVARPPHKPVQMKCSPFVGLDGGIVMADFAENGLLTRLDEMLEKESYLSAEKLHCADGVVD